MTRTRPAAVAGAFYPGDTDALAADVNAMLETGALRLQEASPLPKALIVPHAGYIYSGPIAASAYARLWQGRSLIRRVVLLGPAHRVLVQGLALPSAESFATPLGTIPVDKEAVRAIAHLPQVVVNDSAHALEHSLEVQLPFLQKVLENFTLVPLAVGEASPQEVAEVLDVLWGGPETLILISSDLSHYLPYAEAKKTDQKTVQMILQLRETIALNQACGGIPVNGLLLAARRHGLTPQLLDLRNSGDTAGDKSRVVGYSAFAFTASSGAAQKGVPNSNGDLLVFSKSLNRLSWLSPNSASPDPGPMLLKIARAAIAEKFGVTYAAREEGEFLSKPGATFVTLMQKDTLRGCVGSLEATRPLREDLKANAVAAAFHDKRFDPLTEAELKITEVEVSLLSPLELLVFSSENEALQKLRPGIDGVVLQYQGHRGAFLPQVWEQMPEPGKFIAQLKRKAGLSENFWADGIKLSRYSVIKWKESDYPQELPS